MLTLDNIRFLKNSDRKKMNQDLLNFPLQVKETLKALEEINIPSLYKKASNIVMAGMGGSAIGGELVQKIASSSLSIPFTIIRDYQIPNYINKNTFFIVSSFSGNTEETISACREAASKNASIFIISKNGKLEKFAQEKKYPFLKIPYESFCEQPRACLGTSFAAIIGTLVQLEFLAKTHLSDLEKALEELSPFLSQWNFESATKNNQAKQLAEIVKTKIPIVHGGGIFSSLAVRWKQDINETGKHFAFAEIMPEFNHNAVVGYQFPQRLKRYLIMIALRSASDHPRHKARWESVKSIWDKRELSFLEVNLPGTFPLAQQIIGIVLGQFLSLYLGILHKVDPSPVEIIAFLKDNLAKSK